MKPLARFHPVVLSGFLVLALTALTGCGQRYIITTTSGAKVITATKPKLVQSRYVYKDVNGRTNELSTLRVRSVEPYSKEALGSPMKVPELR